MLEREGICYEIFPWDSSDLKYIYFYTLAFKLNVYKNVNISSNVLISFLS